MRIIGLTGNIGCGKSTVAGMLAERGVAVVDLDAVARELRQDDPPTRAAIEERFGTADAAALGRLVFTDPAALADLEAILHPRIREAAAARLGQLADEGLAVACIEAIKLLESPLRAACDQVWVVRCTEPDALARLAERGLSPDEARVRLTAQGPQAAKLAAADVVIDGSATLDETRRQVRRAYAALVGSPTDLGSGSRSGPGSASAGR